MGVSVAAGGDRRMMDDADVLWVLRLFEESGITCWVDGGWGVDALLGEQTRPHADVDLVLLRGHVPAALTRLADAGFLVVRDLGPTAIALRDSIGREVDLHPVDPTPDGGGDQALPDGTAYHYRGPVRGWIGGSQVLCCPVADQVSCHAGYQPRATDRADMANLAERFGIALPAPYAE